MYKYEYVTLSCEVGDWGFGSGLIYEIEDYRAEIEKRAADGWRYVGCIPTKQSANGYAKEFDLIFEKEV